ncbi:MAG: hypothetical protein QM760_15705 [Nibricoccus sp.]
MRIKHLCALLVLGCLSGFAAEKTVISADTFSQPTFQQHAFWTDTTALQLLEKLERHTDTFITLDSICYNFVRDEDVPILMAKIDSQTPSAAIVSIVASTLPTGKSTVGDQAAYLIECYRNRLCPLGLTSADAKADKAELKRWYALWRLQAPAQFPAAL